MSRGEVEANDRRQKKKEIEDPKQDNCHANSQKANTKEHKEEMTSRGSGLHGFTANLAKKKEKGEISQQGLCFDSHKGRRS